MSNNNNFVSVDKVPPEFLLNQSREIFTIRGQYERYKKLFKWRMIKTSDNKVMTQLNRGESLYTILKILQASSIDKEEERQFELTKELLRTITYQIEQWLLYIWIWRNVIHPKWLHAKRFEIIESLQLVKIVKKAECLNCKQSWTDEMESSIHIDIYKKLDETKEKHFPIYQKENKEFIDKHKERFHFTIVEPKEEEPQEKQQPLSKNAKKKAKYKPKRKIKIRRRQKTSNDEKKVNQVENTKMDQKQVIKDEVKK